MRHFANGWRFFLEPDIIQILLWNLINRQYAYGVSFLNVCCRAKLQEPQQSQTYQNARSNVCMVMLESQLNLW